MSTSVPINHGARTVLLGAVKVQEKAAAPPTPPANTVIIYALDNGSGKTKLMALFATGAAQQIAIEP